MHKLIDYICDELEELERKVGKGEKLSMSEVEYMDILAHSKKNLLKGEEMGGYSERTRYDGMMYNDGRSYRGRSYARKRDSMGRYARDYAMDDAMMDELHRLMAKAPDEATKREFEKFIHTVETM